MREFDAFHLPGLFDGVDLLDPRDTAIADFEVRVYPAGEATVTLRWPILTPSAVRAVADSLIVAGARALDGQPVARTLDAIDRVAARFADPADPVRRTAEEMLPAVTGYHPRMVSAILDGMVRDWRRPALERLLDAEVGGTAPLEDFMHRAEGLRSRAFGPRLAVHIFAGNVPGVSVTAMVRSLLVRAATLGKTASGEPVLAPLFCRALAEESRELGACVAATYWPGGDTGLEAEAFANADAIIVYGGGHAVADLRRRIPLHTRLIEHGPRISFAAVARERLADPGAAGVAKAAARAVALFDQQGCVSPHVFYVEAGGALDAHAFAARLAGELAALEIELPRGQVTAAESAAIHEARATAEFRGLGGDGAVLFAGNGTSYTVIFDPDPAFDASCLNRVVRVKPLPSLEDLAPTIAPFRDVLQSAALEAPEPRRSALAAAFAAAGVTRVTTLERLPWPPPVGHHDGRGPLRELIRWVDLED